MTVDPHRAELSQLRRVVYGVLVVLVLVSAGMTVLAFYVLNRQERSDQEFERVRAGLCSAFAAADGRIPPEIAKQRQYFARPGHPHDCEPVVHPNPTPTVTVRPRAPVPQTTVVIIRPGIRPAPSASPSTARTASPRPTPRTTPTQQPTPTPSPSRTCLLILCRK